MSQLPAEVQTALGQLLAALSSSDNNVRSQAEEHLTNDWVVNRPDVLLMGLVEQMRGSQDTSVWTTRRYGGSSSNRGLGSVVRSSAVPEASLEVEEESGHERIERSILLPEQRSQSRNKAAATTVPRYRTSQSCTE